ncbi:hypothetical protein [Candidatus Kuenenia sp.]|uniref:hypothetical protein n=1 Tax=Candidatus Kuenenia sp. TaxID=2499824 RepID=UPI00322095F6
MQADKPYISGNYLYSILADGARPFLYRSGVRLLLGIPDMDKSSLAFPTSIPAAGFRYANYQVMSEPLNITQCLPPMLNETENSLDIIEESIQQDIPLTAVTINNSLETIPESKQEKVSIKQADKMVESAGDIEGARIEIPGVSGMRQKFPLLSPSKKSDILSNKNEGQFQQKRSPSDLQRNIFRTSVYETREGKSLINSIIQRENLITGEVNAVRSEMAPGSKHKSLPKSGNISVATIEKYKTQPNQTANAPEHLDSDISGKTNKNASDRIRQLRKAIHELSSKKTEQQARTHNETPTFRVEETPPPPVQPVVVIKRYSSQTRTPCAFWERSYLGRFRLRTLR